jgi:hypothetical protein
VRRFVERTAYHEAGHAVAAFALRRAVKHLSIVSDTESNGRVVNHKLPDTFHPDYEDDARTRAFIEREIMIFLAGGVALQKFQGHRRRLGDCQDQRGAVDLANHVCGDPDESLAFIAWLRERTRLLLNQPWHWRAVEDIARTLVEHKELTGRRARRIFQAAIDTYRQDEDQRAAMDEAVGWGSA